MSFASIYHHLPRIDLKNGWLQNPGKLYACFLTSLTSMDPSSTIDHSLPFYRPIKRFSYYQAFRWVTSYWFHYPSFPICHSKNKHVRQNTVGLANKNKQLSLFIPSRKYKSCQPIIQSLLEKQERCLIPNHTLF